MKYRRSLTGKKYSIVASGLLVTILVLPYLTKIENRQSSYLIYQNRIFIKEVLQLATQIDLSIL